MPLRPALATADGWTRLPLDPVLAELRCDDADCELCRVHVHVIEPTGAERDVEHRVMAGAHATFIVREGRSVSGRAEIVRDRQRLAAWIELEVNERIDPNQVLAWLAEPDRARDVVLAARTYEVAEGGMTIVLQESGTASREGRAERQERDEGLEQHAAARAPRYEFEAMASVEQDRRRIATGHSLEGRQWGQDVAEVLAPERRVIRRVGPTGETLVEYVYDDSGQLVAVLRPGGEGEIARIDLRRAHVSPAVLARDARGRPTSIRVGDGATTAIERDDARRLVRTIGEGGSRTVETDEAGRLVREASSWGDWSRTLTRAYDERGRLIATEVVERGGWRGEGELVTRATLAYDERCGLDVEVPDELDLLPAADERIDPLPP